MAYVRNGLIPHGWYICYWKYRRYVCLCITIKLIYKINIVVDNKLKIILINGNQPPEPGTKFPNFAWFQFLLLLGIFYLMEPSPRGWVASFPILLDFNFCLINFCLINFCLTFSTGWNPTPEAMYQVVAGFPILLDLNFCLINLCLASSIEWNTGILGFSVLLDFNFCLINLCSTFSLNITFNCWLRHHKNTWLALDVSSYHIYCCFYTTASEINSNVIFLSFWSRSSSGWRL